MAVGPSTISGLTALTGANVDVDNDKIPVDDVSAGVTKYITPKELIANSLSVTQSGTGAISQNIQDKLRRVSVDLEDYVTNTTPGTTDCSDGLQKAINYVNGLGGGTVNCLRGPYKIATASGSTVTLPGSSATMPYCVELKANVKLKGFSREDVTFIGDHTYRTTAINTSQKIMFRCTHSATGANYFFEDIQFKDCMIPIYSSGIIVGHMRDCAFSGCALPFIAQKAERFEFDGVDFGTPGAGIMIGGWYDASATVDSSWSDKNQFRRINYIRFLAGWTSYENDIDTFFDTNFYKNASGAGTVPYRGVVGIPVLQIARYARGCFNNEISHVFSYGSPRPAIYGGPEHLWDVRNVNIERCGYTDDTLASIMGVGTVDPWNAARMRAAVDVYASSGVSSFENIYATSLAAVDLVSPIQANKKGLTASAAANPGLTNAAAGGATLGESLKLSYANPDIAAVHINATTGTNAAAMKFQNTGGGLFVGIDNSAGGRIGGVAYAGCVWLDYNGTLLFGINNAEAARLTATLFKFPSTVTLQFGTNTAKGAEAFASFITVKDAGGTDRKLMVCA